MFREARAVALEIDAEAGDGVEPCTPGIGVERDERQGKRLPSRVSGEMRLQGLERGKQRETIQQRDETLDEQNIAAIVSGQGPVVEAAHQLRKKIRDSTDRSCAAGGKRRGEMRL